MRYAVLLLAAPLGGCISFGAAPPPSLLTIETAATVPVGLVQRTGGAGAVTVSVPSTPQALATARVPVQATPTTIAYVEDARWVDTPDTLFRDLLGETIAARTGRVVLSDQQRTLDPGARLTGRLLAFSVDADRNEAVVTYDAALLRGQGTRVETRRSEARVPVTTIDRANVSAALNQAANQVADDIATWIGR